MGIQVAGGVGAARDVEPVIPVVGLAGGEGVLELPDLVALLGLDDTGRLILELVRQPPLEGVRGLHQVIVHRNERVASLSRLGVRQQRARCRPLDSELYHLDH